MSKSDWDSALGQLLGANKIYAVVEHEACLDYDLINSDRIPHIIYNQPKPVTPLKMFFLPIKQNVSNLEAQNKQIIIGAPNCDVEALRILDEIYLEEPFTDPFYKQRRENTLIISFDCLDILEHCHCNSYGIDPFASEIADLSIILLENQAVLTSLGKKGDAFIKTLSSLEGTSLNDYPNDAIIEEKHSATIQKLKKSNNTLPGYKESGMLVSRSNGEIWKKYASDCVSCGACSAICPTCSCFLLNDKPAFEKVRQIDTCQYPGFERVAGGEDALGNLATRFRNRYMCKYVWKPETFEALACTGCGRCIETCIGGINKNELIIELEKETMSR